MATSLNLRFTALVSKRVVGTDDTFPTPAPQTLTATVVDYEHTAGDPYPHVTAVSQLGTVYRLRSGKNSTTAEWLCFTMEGHQTGEMPYPAWIVTPTVYNTAVNWCPQLRLFHASNAVSVQILPKLADSDANLRAAWAGSVYLTPVALPHETTGHCLAWLMSKQADFSADCSWLYPRTDAGLYAGEADLYNAWTWSGAASVTAVTLNQTAVTVPLGESFQFTASVTGEGDFADGVTWSLSGNAPSGGTTLSATGLLTIGDYESSPGFTVTATSVQDGSVSASAAVTVPDFVSKLRVTAYTADMTDTSGTVTFHCTDLASADTVYRVKAWLRPMGEAADTASAPTYTSPLFGGPSHSLRCTFTGLTPGVGYDLYAVIWLDTQDAASEHFANADFTTTASDAVLTLTAENVGGDGFTLRIHRTGLHPGTDYIGAVSVYQSATSAVVFREELELTGNGADTCAVTGLEPEVAYAAAVSIYPAPAGANVLTGELAVTIPLWSGWDLYVGVGGTARRVKEVYVGVDGVARRVVGIYTGVNGLAEPVG